MWTQCERNLQHERGLIANTANENQWHMTYSYSTQFPANYFSFPTKNYITYRQSDHFQFHSIWPCGNKQVSPWPNEDPFVVLQTSRRMYIFKEHSEHSCKLKGKQNIEAPSPNNTSIWAIFCIAAPCILAQHKVTNSRVRMMVATTSCGAQCFWTHCSSRNLNSAPTKYFMVENMSVCNAFCRVHFARVLVWYQGDYV